VITDGAFSRSVRPLIAAAMAGTRTLHARGAPPIPVFIFYTTAIVRADATVEFFEDVYGLDARLERELAAAGRSS